MTTQLQLEALRLYAITAGGDARRPHARQKVRAWLQAGVRAIQLREKYLPRLDVEPFGRFLRTLTSEYGALFIVNDDPLLALELKADGCHLGQDDMSVAEARRILGRDKILGLSTHSREQVMEAAPLDVDYIGVGPIYRSSTKDAGRALLGPRFAGWAAGAIDKPVVAIGGVTLENVARLVAEGCTNVAIVSALDHVHKPEASVRAFLDILSPVDSSNLPG